MKIIVFLKEYDLVLVLYYRALKSSQPNVEGKKMLLFLFQKGSNPNNEIKYLPECKFFVVIYYLYSPLTH